jgi:Kyakuja-Dileera-Zisupton transposase
MSEYYIRTKAAAKHPPKIHERGMAVINDVIDQCKDSYLAVKDYRIRILKEHSDKGLIVMVCQHDHVIWFINMGPNGEKRYFMLTMIQKLLRELPESFTIGFFYDVICAMHREMEWVCNLSYNYGWVLD